MAEKMSFKKEEVMGQDMEQREPAREAARVRLYEVRGKNDGKAALAIWRRGFAYEERMPRAMRWANPRISE